MKNRTALVLLLAANTITQFSQGISMIAIPWYFTHLLHEESLFGFVYAIITILMVLWSPYAGTLIDRYSRKTIAMLISFFSALVVLFVSILGYSEGYVPTPFVIVVFGFTLANYHIHYPNLYAFAQEITAKKEYARINSYLEVQGQVTLMIAGAMGAILITGVENNTLKIIGSAFTVPYEIKAWSLQKIFLLNAFTYFIAVLLLSLIRYTPAVARNIETGSLYKRIKGGFRFLLNNPSLFIFGNASYSIFVTVMVAGYFLFPMYVSNHLQEGADVFASCDIFFALGALTAGIFTRKIMRYMNTVIPIILMLMISGVSFYLGAITKSTFIFFGICILLGFCNSGTRILRITYLFNHISNDIIGRAMSVFAMINIILRSGFIALFSLALFSSGGNVVNTFVVFSFFVVLSGIVLIIYYGRLEKN
ncbi:MFS transporter [Candidatus Amoebophilus asiaticus]|nr:MFS transporter [Candidatus Amoebophilus asiaticus]